jgi:hypothetical protein
MLCVYKRKANTTDEVLLQRYENIKFDPFWGKEDAHYRK